jgi:molybdopterin converting factor subunit 1
MRVKVLLFARLRELVGASELHREAPPGAAIADLWRGLVADYPGLEPHTATVSAARNDDFARMATPIAEGDRVAFLPPVSGG